MHLDHQKRVSPECDAKQRHIQVLGTKLLTTQIDQKHH